MVNLQVVKVLVEAKIERRLLEDDRRIGFSELLLVRNAIAPTVIIGGIKLKLSPLNNGIEVKLLDLLLIQLLVRVVVVRVPEGRRPVSLLRRDLGIESGSAATAATKDLRVLLFEEPRVIEAVQRCLCVRLATAEQRLFIACDRLSF